jgi:hypothetical protein
MIVAKWDKIVGGILVRFWDQSPSSTRDKTHNLLLCMDSSAYFRSFSSFQSKKPRLISAYRVVSQSLTLYATMAKGTFFIWTTLISPVHKAVR